MSELLKVSFYYGIRAKDHIIDHLVQPDPPMAWEPVLANIQQRNIMRLFEMANLSPMDWRAFLIERFEFDPIKPTEAGLLAAGVQERHLEAAMRIATEMAENWELQQVSDAWSFDADMPMNLVPRQVYEILSETRGRGTPVISFQGEEHVIEQALTEDNLLAIQSPGGIFVGLSDPINGYNWAPADITGPVYFRPSMEGLVVLNDDHLFEYVVDDAYTASVSYAPGEPVRLSSRSTETSRLPPPVFRDQREGRSISAPVPR